MGYANMAELTAGLAQYFAFYNAERPHQALNYETPDRVCSAGIGGGALIVDKFGDADQEQEKISGAGQRRAAAEVEMGTAYINRLSVLTDGATLMRAGAWCQPAPLLGW